MKPVIERLTPTAEAEIVAVERVQGNDFGCQWHFHPEVELTYVAKGGTHRWIGDKMTALREHDLVLIGSNLPHDYRNDLVEGIPPTDVDALVIQFQPGFLGNAWLERAGMDAVNQLFKKASHGLEITGKTRDSVVSLMKSMEKLHGMRRLIALLEILDLLSTSSDLETIASPGFEPAIQQADSERMSKIVSYIQKHMEDTLYLREVAKHAGMTEVSFSRYFRSRTGKTFPAYLNELRVARICRQLAESDATISEIALGCGYESFANFERQFHRLHGCSPKEYRARALRKRNMSAG